MLTLTVTVTDKFLTDLNNWLHEFLCSKYGFPFVAFPEDEKLEETQNYIKAAIELIKLDITKLEIVSKYRRNNDVYQPLQLVAEHFNINIKSPFSEPMEVIWKS